MIWGLGRRKEGKFCFQPGSQGKVSKQHAVSCGDPQSKGFKYEFTCMHIMMDILVVQSLYCA